jgi:hypothetical protein
MTQGCFKRALQLKSRGIFLDATYDKAAGMIIANQK